jgi:hypothetical protein
MIALLLIGCIDYSIQNPVSETIDPIEDTAAELVPIADAPVYANTSESLFEVEPTTGDTVWVGLFQDEFGPIDKFVDIAINMDGIMYGGTYDALYLIDPNTAQVEKICNTSVDMMALAFTFDGVLVAGGAETIVTIDLNTCQTSLLIDSSGYFETSGDLVGLPDGFLYWTVRGEDNEGDDLVRLDPTTGMWAWVGKIGVDRLYGLGYHHGTLYGFNSDGEIAAISPSTGQSDILASDSGMSWWGATTNPVSWEE